MVSRIIFKYKAFLHSAWNLLSLLFIWQCEKRSFGMWRWNDTTQRLFSPTHKNGLTFVQYSAQIVCVDIWIFYFVSNCTDFYLFIYFLLNAASISILLFQFWLELLIALLVKSLCCNVGNWAIHQSTRLCSYEDFLTKRLSSLLIILWTWKSEISFFSGSVTAEDIWFKC